MLSSGTGPSLCYGHLHHSRLVFPALFPPPKMTKCNRTATKPASHPEEGPQSHALAHTRGRMRTKQSLSPRISPSSEHCVSDLA